MKLETYPPAKVANLANRGVETPRFAGTSGSRCPAKCELETYPLLKLLILLIGERMKRGVHSACPLTAGFPCSVCGRSDRWDDGVGAVRRAGRRP